jgi:tetratricopeptide (TPR) repeat protein
VADKNFIKIIILLTLGTIAAIALTFYSATLQSEIEDFDKNISKVFEESNTRIDHKEVIISNFHRLVDLNLKVGTEYMDSIILYGGFGVNDRTVFHWIVGEVCYDVDSIDLALARFDTSSMESPRNLANIAGCFVKKSKYSEALFLLRKAASINISYDWYVGNVQEIIGNKDSAILLYKSLYDEDSEVYHYCDEQLIKMKDPDYKSPKFIEFRDRRKMTYLRMRP